MTCNDRLETIETTVTETSAAAASVDTAGAAFLFPGQGAQAVGMGNDLARVWPNARRRFEEADDILGYSLSRICFDGPREALDRDLTAQLAVYTVSCIIRDRLASGGRVPALLTGYSSGFYAAAYAAGCYGFADGLRIVRQAGEILAERGRQLQGAMAVVFGLPVESVEEVCREVGRVHVAIVNTPRQIIVSGERGRLAAVMSRCSARGALDTGLLPASACYHSPLMAPCGSHLSQALGAFGFDDPTPGLVSYSSLKTLKTGSEVKTALGRQLERPVRWVDVVRKLRRSGCRMLVEVGPGTMLYRTVRWIDRSCPVVTTQTAEEIRKLLETDFP